MIRPEMLCPAWPQKPLGEAVEFLDHLRRPITARDRISGPYPYYGANGQQDSIADYIFDEPLILMAEDGGYFGDPDRTIAYRVDGKCWVNNHAHVFRPKDGIDIGFLCRQLEKYDVTRFIKGATRQKLNKSNASEIPITLPPLAEQKRIAAILDKADAIRCKRRQAIQLADEFLRSVFLDMFGDPVTNVKGWKRCNLEDVLENIDSGWSPKCLDRVANQYEWGVLKLGAVTSCLYLDHENKALPRDLEPRGNIEVKKGDLLFTRKNTYELVAACAFVYWTRPKLMLSDTIFRFNFKRNAAILPEYVWALFTHPGKRRDLQKLAGGSAGSMPNISKSRLMKQMIELPPINLQEKFRNVFYRVRSCIENQSSAHNFATEFFNSLTQRAFRGEL